jgi:hypothetical protein
MAQSTELSAILRSYALKTNSPLIVISAFLDFVEKYASYRVHEQADWAKWTTDVETKFWEELPPLIEDNRCVLLSDASTDRIYMPFFCLEKLREMYQNSDKMADIPFPDESFLNVTIPEGQAQVISLATEIPAFFAVIAKNVPLSLPEAPREDTETASEASPIKEKASSLIPEEIREDLIKIILPESYGSALIPSGLLPRRLLEAAFLKLRFFLQSHGNKDYFLHKLSPYLPGREKYLREMLDLLIVQPTECIRNLEGAGDSSTMFWTCFCSLIKTDVRNKTDLLTEDVAAIQSAFIIDACNGFYKNRDAQRKEVEAALRNLDQHLDRSPFYYTLDDIIKFTNDKEVPLLNIYTKQDLEAHIKKRTTEGRRNELPDWLILQGGKDERWYIKKNKYLPLCTKMLIGARPNIRKEIVNRWLHLMKEFRKEPAMEQDDEFDRLLAAYTMNENPALLDLLEDPKLLLVYSEMERSQTAIPPASRIFKAGKLLPMSALYAFRRKDMVTDVKFLLPFWYSIPILANIIVFFQNKGKKKQVRKRRGRGNVANTSLEGQGAEGPRIQNAAQSIVAAMVPQGLSIDDYLSELESRWSMVLDEDARKNLVSDVRALLRDNLRYAVKIHKTSRISQESLGDIADSLISNTAALQRLGGRQALRQYMQLYMARLLSNYR